MDARKLKILFLGTPEFAVASLRRLVEGGYNVVGVVTMPDKPAGRGLKLQQSAVKEYALSAGLPLFQPEKLRDEAFLEQIRALAPDLGIVIAFRMLPEAVWAMPRLGTFNLHASLLPHYRGAAPINWAVINGETRTGVTTFMLNHQIDTGDILAQREVDITPADTAGTLHDRLMEVGSELVVETVEAIAAGRARPVSQNVIGTPASAGTSGNDGQQIIKEAPKISKDDCRIDWSQPGERIVNLVRGLSPLPGAWGVMAGPEDEIMVKIFAAEFHPACDPAAPGTIISDERTRIEVACLDGYITLEQLQLAGKRPLPPAELLRGFKGIASYTFK